MTMAVQQVRKQSTAGDHTRVNFQKFNTKETHSVFDYCQQRGRCLFLRSFPKRQRNSQARWQMTIPHGDNRQIIVSTEQHQSRGTLNRNRNSEGQRQNRSEGTEGCLVTWESMWNVGQEQARLQQVINLDVSAGESHKMLETIWLRAVRDWRLYSEQTRCSQFGLMQGSGAGACDWLGRE